MPDGTRAAAAVGYPLRIALLVAAAFFMENLDGTVIATALQQMTMGMGIAFGAEGNGTGVPSVMDFRIAFGLVALVALAALFDVRTLTPDAGAEVSGHRRGRG